MDDIYVHYRSKTDAAKGLISLAERLRQNGLNLNENKSGIIGAKRLVKEETDLDRLFQAASEQVETERRLRWSYSFNDDWESPVEEEGALAGQSDDQPDLDAVVSLFRSREQYPRTSDKIDRFCIPILRAAKSDVGIDAAIQGFNEKPHMAKIYSGYLQYFVQKTEVRKKLEEMLANEEFVSDWQLMYLLACLSQAPALEKTTVNTALKLLESSRVTHFCRAISALLASKHGNAQQQHHVRLAYESEQSPFVRSAILYSSKNFSADERRACKKAWGGHSELNALISAAL